MQEQNAIKMRSAFLSGGVNAQVESGEVERV